MLIWLENPTVEAGPLKTLLKSFAGQNSNKHRHSDGEPLHPFRLPQRWFVCLWSASDESFCLAVRSGFLHLAEALAYRRDIEPPLIAVIAMLKSGERCNAEPELIGKGTNSLMTTCIMFDVSISNISQMFFFIL